NHQLPPVSLHQISRSVSVAAHRRWVNTVRKLPEPLASWVANDAAGEASHHVLDLGNRFQALQQQFSATRKSLARFGEILRQGPFDILCSEGTPTQIAARADRLLQHIALLPSFASMLRRRKQALEMGLGNLVAKAEEAPTPIDLLLQTFRAAVAWQQAKAVWDSDEGLRLFRSGEFELLRAEFQDLDGSQLKDNQKYIARQLASSRIEEGTAGTLPRDLSDLQLIRHELGKRRKHLPIRKLVQRAGVAMQGLCPCWMMTPLAVAQFLPTDLTHFDVVIMDEASQLNPEDTWGAIARATQVVVVGDPKQMPPSDFFSSTFEEEDTVDDDELDGGRADSILEAAVLSLHNKWLEWHYRSRHETLIAPANQFSYSRRLVLFPSSYCHHPELGVRYFFIHDAVTTHGKVINSKEADSVAKRLYELVMAQSRRPSDKRLSIGVVAMNIHQQECIQELVDAMRRGDSAFDTAVAAMEADSAEPLFVKNLENIQGDERDIMLISCTYGPQTPGGTPAQRFGPLNREGGERRFNVLITRAKWRMEVFSSLKSHQIVIEAKKRGIQDFHLFLKYAETGRLDEPGQQTRRGHDSPFEAQVDAFLTRAGYTVESQVGVAGYFIDLAVRHPSDKGRFAIGIECDGITYHSSKAARDRDRLREQVLKERGWKLHRIWSTDWFANSRLARIATLKAVEAACRQ
ncbi:MAG: AAA domain-containing protein, partial [Verrucomicrobiota bacterium]